MKKGEGGRRVDDGVQSKVVAEGIETREECLLTGAFKMNQNLKIN